MPLLVGPYTMGSFQGAAGAAPQGGAAYYTRRKRYMEWLLMSLLFFVLAC
jgi:hypothetical protein